MKVILTLLVFSMSFCMLQSQKLVDIKLHASDISDQSSCFDIMLRSAEGHDINLAGQNYRIFYNGDKAQFRPDLITHNLDKWTYGKLDVQHSNDQNIGFVSISLDSRKMTEEVVKLDRKGVWVKTMNICFDQEQSSTLDLTWANDRKTARYATAEVTFSEWVDPDNQQVLEPNEVLDYSSADFIAARTAIELTLYPNPTSELLQVELNNNTEMRRLIIKDVIGREYISQEFDGTDVMSYDVTRWPEGAYTVMLSNPDGKFVAAEKVIKINR